MAQEIRKPANWENSTFEDLFTIEAGQAYVAKQFGGSVDSVKNFRSNRERSDACSYELFEDGSLWFHNNAQDEIWADVSDFVRELQFTGVYWEDTRDRDGFLVDAMDRNLLVHLWGEDDAREFFESAGGIVSCETDGMVLNCERIETDGVMQVRVEDQNGRWGLFGESGERITSGDLDNDEVQKMRDAAESFGFEEE